MILSSLLSPAEKSFIWSCQFFQQFFPVAGLYTKNLRFILGRFGGGYFGSKKYNTANEMDEAWEPCPFFSNGDVPFFPTKIRPCVWMALERGVGKEKGSERLSVFHAIRFAFYFLSLRDS